MMKAFLSKFSFSATIILLMALNTLAQFSYDKAITVKPWNTDPVLPGRDYTFVVMGDHTGGEKPGVLPEVVKRINDLSPDFVVTVGDLVGGYTNDSNFVERNWDEMDSILGKLEMPYFRVAGNHDITNSMMKGIWNRRYGPTYYSFSAGEALFLILSTCEPDTKGIPPDQVAFAREILQKQPEDKLTFIVMHYPIWDMYGKGGIKELETITSGRNIIWLFGDKHRYLFRTINNQPHFQLSQVAADIKDLRGPEMAEFNNLMQFTIRGNNYRAANIDIAGLLPHDVVSEKTEKQVNALNDADWAYAVPVFSFVPEEKIIRSSLQLKNKGDYPLEIKGNFAPPEGLSVFPDKVNKLLLPGEKAEFPLTLTAHAGWYPDTVTKFNFRSSAAFIWPGHDLNAQGNAAMIIDFPHRIALTDKNKENFSAEQKPFRVEESWDWSGLNDASFRYAVSYDSRFIYLKIKVSDDKINRLPLQKQSDRLSLWLSNDTASGEINNRIHFLAGNTKPISDLQSGQFKHIKTTCETTGQHLTASIIIARKELKGNYFRINISYHDVDDPLNMDHATLWWKPEWGSKADYKYSGLFLLE